MAESLTDFVHAVPLAGVRAFGFGGVRHRGVSAAAARLTAVRGRDEELPVAAQTAGVTGGRLLRLLASAGGTVTREQLEFHTAAADHQTVVAALDRLVAADLVVRGDLGQLHLAPPLLGRIPGVAVSLAEPQLVTSDQVAQICRRLRIAKPPTRKQERIAAIADFYSDPASVVAVRAELSDEAWKLLLRIADQTAEDDSDDDDDDELQQYAITHVMSSYSYRPRGQSVSNHRAQVVQELTSRGLVGSGWSYDLWIWAEAWPILDRPFIPDWSVPAPPAVVAVQPSMTRIPRLVADLDLALKAWTVSPPPVLKNGELRVGKTDSRALGKSLGVKPGVVDLLGRSAIGVGLLLANTVSESGRGRNRRIDEVWLPDPELVAVWQQLPAIQRWLRLVAEWCQPSGACTEQQLITRHLLLWELANLPPAMGFADVESFTPWFAAQYAPSSREDLAAECVDDLRALGMVYATGPLALTDLGRMALLDPKATNRMEFESTTQVVVQADHTIIGPPDLDPEVAARLITIATVESEAGAFIYRLDPQRITRAVHGGQSEEEILSFLAEVSSAAVPDPVTWLVKDAAARAERIKVIAAPTVVVVSDAADLTTACAIKAIKLVRLTDTVAVSQLAAAKVQAALDGKGLTPQLILGSAGAKPRSHTDATRSHRSPSPAPQAPAARGLLVTSRFAMTPDLTDRLDRV